MLGARMAEVTEPEYHVLSALSVTVPRSVTVLARMSGVSRVEVRKLLQRHVRDGFVAVLRQRGRVEYELTPRGAGRLATLQSGAKEGSMSSGESNWAASYRSTLAESRAQAARDARASELLTDDERARCAAELTRQHKMELLGDDELRRRRAKLSAAVTRRQLVQVFDGLPAPPVDGPQFAPVRTRLWLKLAMGSLFNLVLTGYGIFTLVTGSGWSDYVLGGACVLLALVHSRGSIRWLTAVLRQRSQQTARRQR
ncbi:hypothetical protein [Kribbella sp. NPDC051718]|uniref:hypothetical protein n=1 Tax=Kribbella sp. NPDC051718 TaxID=3155168 RepID=UPI003417A38F